MALFNHFNVIFFSCCVDFISADHLKAEAIIHFGPYCSNKYVHELCLANLILFFRYDIPVCFLPDFQSKNELNGQIFFEISLFIDQIKSKNLLVITDKILASFEAFEQMCVDKELNLCFSSIENVENCDKSTKIFDFYFPLDRNDFKDTSLIYIGPHEKLALDLGCIFYNHASLCIDSKSQSIFSPSISRELAKKSGFVDAISSFDHVGILIENPNVRLYVEIAHYLQKICAANDIIADVIYVGRLNEMKIGNFPDIEFFIHLSCSGRASFSFVKPIVSPLEFLCSKFNLDFWENQYLRDYSAFIAYCDKEKKMLLPNHEDQENIDGQLVIKSFYELSTQIVSTRKNYSYNGLEINSAFQEMRLHKGATGNSTSYDYESHE